MTSRRTRAGAIVAALVIATPLVAGAAPAPRPAGICESFLSFLCPKTDPDPPETTAPDDPSTPDTNQPDVPTGPDTSDPELPGELHEYVPDVGTPGIPNDPDTEEDPDPAPVDEAAPIFTGTPAAMRAGGLSFTGLRGISIVSVPTADGGSVRTLKIDADSITISGFALTVRPPEEPGLVTTADTMSLQGNVSVYLGSITASAPGGEPLTIGTDTPPPLDEIEPGLLDVTMGLVGSTADSITYTNTDQNIVEAEDG